MREADLSLRDTPPPHTPPPTNTHTPHPPHLGLTLSDFITTKMLTLDFFK